ncbi:MAG: chorismate synthase [Firmicutes bacterium]|nr:chorismate synthase [Bacillota bacterium]
MRFLTAGESHGPGLVVIVEGLPRGVVVSQEAIAVDLARRQQVYGRGPRAQSEPEIFEVLGGLRGGRTTGAPVAVLLRHRRWELWRSILDPWEPAVAEKFVPTSDLAGVEAFPTRPRPGHADLAAAQKYGLEDLRDAIERASARETAARTVAGALARAFLGHLGIRIGSFVTSIGPVAIEELPPPAEALRTAEESPVRAADRSREAEMMAAIDAARAVGDTLGGVFVVVATGVPAGLGSYMSWDKRLDARLAAALMSIPSVKGVEIGDGFGLAGLPGSAAHDPIRREGGVIHRGRNRAGGIEGGLSNGQPIIVRNAVKPVPTLYRPLPSIDLKTGEATSAAVERSDVCVVPAAAVVGEAMVAWVLAEAVLEKCGGDTLREVERALAAYRADWPWPADG